MNSCLIFGFGRSGTSMVGGLLSESGYYPGENSYSPRSSNPLGFFEDAKINKINERILETYDFDKTGSEVPRHGKTYSPYHPRYGHRWLSFIDPGSHIVSHDPEIGEEIASVLKIGKPFAYKDPRFSYTLKVWTEFLDENVKYICIFREPSRVVNSVILECSTTDYLSDFYISKSLAYKLWYNCYLNILNTFYPQLKDQMLFISYDHFICGDLIHELSDFLDAKISPSFVDKNLNRSIPDQQAPREIEALYMELLKLSGVTN